MTISPAATRRTTSITSSTARDFSTYPHAPAESASAIASDRSTPVSSTTFASGAASRILRVASIPLVPGMSRSISTTFGSFPRSAIASSASRAEPTSRTSD